MISYLRLDENYPYSIAYHSQTIRLLLLSKVMFHRLISSAFIDPLKNDLKITSTLISLSVVHSINQTEDLPQVSIILQNFSMQQLTNNPNPYTIRDLIPPNPLLIIVTMYKTMLYYCIFLCLDFYSLIDIN